MVDMEERLVEIKMLIAEGAYFSINRARQYGKTTILNALRSYLHEYYNVAAIDFQFLTYEDFKDEYTFTKAFANRFALSLRDVTGLDQQVINAVKKIADNNDCSLAALFECLSKVCETSDKPVVLLIDEVDSASNNQVFMDFLALLRGYYLSRDEFPTFQSVILAGVYDLKNLRNKIRPKEEHRYNSPWNIAADFDIRMEFDIKDIEGMLKEYEQDNQTGMDIPAIAGLIYDYTSGYPFLVSRICKIIAEKIYDVDKDIRVADGTRVNSAWTKNGFLEAVKIILSEHNALFSSLVKQLHDYPELREMIYKLLFSGDQITFNKLNPVIDIASMFGFVKNLDGKVVVSNRIFETILYNFFTSEEEVGSSIFKAGAADKNKFIHDGILDMNLVMERFAVEFNKLYSKSDEKFIEDNCRKFFLLYLKPIINGTGHYYVESRTRDDKRTDIIVNYHSREYIIETKIWHGEEYNKRGEEQLADYLDIYEAKKGWLLSFNFNKNKVSCFKEIKCGDKVLYEVVV